MDRFDWHHLDQESYIEIQLFKVSALYELQKVDAAKELLKSLAVQPELRGSPLLEYARGKLAYFEEDFDQAEESFAHLSQRSNDSKTIFRGLLGLANIFYSSDQLKKIPLLIARLESLKAYVTTEDLISLEMLTGNFYREYGPDQILAKRYFSKALSMATHKSWNYFIMRALYGLASVSQKNNKQQDLRCTLEILEAMLQYSESVFFKHLVNRKFKESNFSINTAFKINSKQMTVCIEGKLLDLHKSPMIFNFIELLHQHRDFVAKPMIANTLWPEQTYLPKSHDPRIFDLAKRVRQIVEINANNPVILLSGRAGFKLAISTSDSELNGG